MTEILPGSEARAPITRLIGWGMIGQASYLLSQFVLLFALARFAGVEDVGRLGLASAIVVPVNFLFNFGLRTNQATDVARSFTFREFFWLRVLGTGAASLVILGIAFAFLDPEARLVTIVFGAAKAVEAFSELCYGLFQRLERLQYVARSLTLRGLGSAVVFTAVLYGTGNTPLAYLGLGAVWLVVMVFVDLLPARRIAAREDGTGRVVPRALLRLAWSSLPLGINDMLAGLQGNMPRYIIGWQLGIAALGQFTVVGYVMQALTTMVMAISHSINARFAYNIQQGARTAFYRVLVRLLVLIMALGVVGMLVSLVIGDWLIHAVFGPDYADLGTLLAIALLAAALRACVTILQAGLFAFRRFHLSMMLRILSTALMVVACLTGAWLDGLIGLAWGMTVTLLVHAVMLWYIIGRQDFPEPGEIGGS